MCVAGGWQFNLKGHREKKEESISSIPVLLCTHSQKHSLSYFLPEWWRFEIYPYLHFFVLLFQFALLFLKSLAFSQLKLYSPGTGLLSLILWRHQAWISCISFGPIILPGLVCALTAEAQGSSGSSVCRSGTATHFNPVLVDSVPCASSPTITTDFTACCLNAGLRR